MKPNLRTLKRRLYKLSLIKDRISRVKYYRGHCVHSPFVYGMVRTVFMHSKAYSTTCSELTQSLVSMGISTKRSSQLANVMKYCKANIGVIDSFEGDFCVFSPTYPTSLLYEAYEKCRTKGAVMVIASPYADRERRNVCQALFTSHPSTSIDNRAYIIFMNNDLPKQHFRL